MSKKPDTSRKNEYLGYLRKMMCIRAFEEKVFELLARDVLQGASHVYAGEEAVAVGACAAIGPDDYITSTHRGHGHCVARGGELKFMLAELCGKVTGYCKGKGGSMHIADVRTGNLGATGIVAGNIPVATGAGLACKLNGKGQVVLCFFGDGASNNGTFHESLNMAGMWKLPVVYICENNLYGMSVSVSRTSPCAARPTTCRARSWTARCCWTSRPPSRRPWPAPAPARDRRSSSARPTAGAAIRAATPASTGPRTKSITG